jgi:hypothetical protein
LAAVKHNPVCWQFILKDIYSQKRRILAVNIANHFVDEMYFRRDINQCAQCVKEK